MPSDPGSQRQQHNPQDASTSLPAVDAASLLEAFTTFLTLALHSLLYHRGLYPPATFLTARALNLPVHQSRHPGVCAWIADAVAAVDAQLRRAAIRRVALVVHAPPQQQQQQQQQQKILEVLERWVFDLDRFPAWGDAGEAGAEVSAHTGEEGEGDEESEEIIVDEDEDDDEGAGQAPAEEDINWTDVNEALRGALTRLAYGAEKLPRVPPGSTFTVAIELRDDAQAPIGHPQPWIPAQPNLQPAPKPQRNKQPPALKGAHTTPIRSVRAGPIFFECWVEQRKQAPVPLPSPQHGNKAQAQQPKRQPSTSRPS